jgi:hypothetical protein
MSPIPLGILAVAGSAPASAYELIQTQVIGGETVSVTLSSIPQTYKHLQIRGVVRLGGFNTSAGFNMRLNNDSTSNYYWHRLRGVNDVASVNIHYVCLCMYVCVYTSIHMYT